MVCTKCQNVLIEDSSFCGNCGQKVELQLISNEVEEKFENPHLVEIKNHLEYLGYSCEFLSIEDKKRVTLIAKHAVKYNIVLTTSAENVIFLSSLWTGVKELNSIEQYRLLNSLILASTLAQIVINKESELVIYSTYVGAYSKNGFGEFFDLYISDIDRVFANVEFKSLLVE